MFRENGSATITCPLRCEEQTMLKRDETINDLGTPYTVKSMLDTYKADLATSPTKDTEPVCRQVENCSRSISVHCCGALMCTACHADHMESSEDSVRHRKRDIKFNKRENKLRVICNEHSARCTHTTTDRSPFVYCVYCVNRGAKDEDTDIIEDQADARRNVLRRELQRSKRNEQVLQKTAATIEDAKVGLKRVLEQRKQECMASYEKLLDGEAERLTHLFDNVADSHLNVYKEDMVKVESSEQLLKGDKLDVEVVLSSDVITELSSRPFADMSVSLTESSDLGATPLGDIQTKSNVPDPSRSSLEYSWYETSIDDPLPSLTEVEAATDDCASTSKTNDEEDKPAETNRRQSRRILRARRSRDGGASNMSPNGDEACSSRNLRPRSCRGRPSGGASPGASSNTTDVTTPVRFNNPLVYNISCDKGMFGELNSTPLASVRCADNRIYLSVMSQVIRAGYATPEKYTLSVGIPDVQQVFVHFGRAPTFIAIKPSVRFAEVACKRIGKEVLVPDSWDPNKRHIILARKTAFKHDAEASGELIKLVNCLSPWTKVNVLTLEAAKKLISESTLDLDDQREGLLSDAMHVKEEMDE